MHLRPRKTTTMETSTKVDVHTASSTTKSIPEPTRPQELITLQSSYMLQDEMRVYIVAILSLVWLSAQIRRCIEKDLNADCWYGWDALGLAVMAFLGQQQRWAVACIFSAFFLVWTRLPGSPFNDFHLPSFGAFLETASEPRTDSAVNQEATESAEKTEETSACLVCWSSGESTIVLPCKHLICSDCLVTMKDRRQTCCPMCRRLLFHNNDGLRCAIHKAVVATLAARLTANGILYILQLRHGQHWEVFKSAVTYLPQFYCFRILHDVTSTQGVEWWQFGMFDYLMPIPVPEGRFWRSVWPPLVFTVLFIMGVFSNLWKIGKLDLVVERVVHQWPYTELYAS